MGPDDRQHPGWALVVTVKERLRRLQEGVQGGKERTLGHRTAARSPQPLHRVQPGAVGGPIEPPEPPRCGSYDRPHRIITLGVGVIPGDLDGPGRMPIDHGLPPFGDFPATFAAAEEPHGCTRMIVDGAQAIPLVRLPWGGKHELLAPRAPPRAPGGPPADVQFVRIVKPSTGLQMITGLFHRLFFPAYSESGRLI
jgi:hypothetical protein